MTHCVCDTDPVPRVRRPASEIFGRRGPTSVRVARFVDQADGKAHVAVTPGHYPEGSLGTVYYCGRLSRWGDKREDEPVPATGSERPCRACEQKLRIGLRLGRIVLEA